LVSEAETSFDVFSHEFLIQSVGNFLSTQQPQHSEVLCFDITIQEAATTIMQDLPSKLNLTVAVSVGTFWVHFFVWPNLETELC
jgi:hypothetical protein